MQLCYILYLQKLKAEVTVWSKVVYYLTLLITFLFVGYYFDFLGFTLSFILFLILSPPNLFHFQN